MAASVHFAGATVWGYGVPVALVSVVNRNHKSIETPAMAARTFSNSAIGRRPGRGLRMASAPQRVKTNPDTAAAR